MTRIFFSIFLLFFLFLFALPIFFLLNSQPININQDKIVYDLPYPGILPDNPLYFLKEIRDKVWDLVTRDNFKKAKLYLLFSDKRVAMAKVLAQKGKDKQAIQTFTSAENYFLKIIQLIKNSKNQGVSPPGDFILTLKQSNTKHREVAQTLLKSLPQGQNEAINNVLELNNQIKKVLEKL